MCRWAPVTAPIVLAFSRGQVSPVCCHVPSHPFMVRLCFLAPPVPYVQVFFVLSAEGLAVSSELIAQCGHPVSHLTTALRLAAGAQPCHCRV